MVSDELEVEPAGDMVPVVVSSSGERLPWSLSLGIDVDAWAPAGGTHRVTRVFI